MNAENSNCDFNASNPSFYNPHFHNLHGYMTTMISREVCVSAEQFLCERRIAERNGGKKPYRLLSLKHFIPKLHMKLAYSYFYSYFTYLINEKYYLYFFTQFWKTNFYIDVFWKDESIYLWKTYLPSCRAKAIISQSKPLKRKEAIK